jgi:hypothetical protein
MSVVAEEEFIATFAAKHDLHVFCCCLGQIP